jgi:hypothetical protein
MTRSHMVWIVDGRLTMGQRSTRPSDSCTCKGVQHVKDV